VLIAAASRAVGRVARCRRPTDRQFLLRLHPTVDHRKLDPLGATMWLLWSTSFHSITLPHVSDIDWNLELRKIEREYDGLPPERSRTQLRLQKIQEIAAKDRFLARLALVGIWAQLILFAALGTSLFWWPYGRSCGMPLAAYLFSYGIVIIGAVTLALRAWRDRLPWIFIGSMASVALAWTVIALNVMPRLGSSPAAGTTARWSCAAGR